MLFADIRPVADPHPQSIGAMISLHNFSSTSQFAVPGATHSTLQDFRFPDSSGGYTYEESDSFHTVTANRLIVWYVRSPLFDP